MGGEKCPERLKTASALGSPPHGRGKVGGMISGALVMRITPAWAGKSFNGVSHNVPPWDHPRMGGEKSMVCPRSDPGTGSPPHGRGKASDERNSKEIRRITPAWAGKRRPSTLGCAASGDHPRMGGEKAGNVLQNTPCSGSPPHGRGKAIWGPSSLWRVRITPAWAGKRLKRSHRSGIFISGPIPFHSALHRPAGSGGSRAGRDGSPAGQPQNAGPA